MSNPKLRSSEYVPFALKSAGIIRVNHDVPSCSGSSKSIVITTRSDGTVTAKCFRCGGVGLTRPSGFVHAVSGMASTVVRPYKVEIPKDTVGWSEFPIEARKWLLKARMTPLLCGQYMVQWSKKFDTLIIPVFDKTTTKLVAVLHRGFGETNRYRLLTEDGDNAFLIGDSFGGDTLVIVEDSLSCIRVSDAGIPAIALLGVYLRKGVKKYLIEKKIKRVVVWLDNDNSKVLMQARAIAKELSWLETKVVSGKSDAKYYSETEIREIIWKA